MSENTTNLGLDAASGFFLSQAIDLAFRHRGTLTISILPDGTCTLRTRNDPAPPSAKTVCVVQWWSESTRHDGSKFETVQVRRSGAVSHFVHRDEETGHTCDH